MCVSASESDGDDGDEVVQAGEVLVKTVDGWKIANILFRNVDRPEPLMYTGARTRLYPPIAAREWSDTIG